VVLTIHLTSTGVFLMIKINQEIQPLERLTGLMRFATELTSGLHGPAAIGSGIQFELQKNICLCNLNGYQTEAQQMKFFEENCKKPPIDLEFKCFLYDRDNFCFQSLQPCTDSRIAVCKLCKSSYAEPFPEVCLVCKSTKLG